MHGKGWQDSSLWLGNSLEMCLGSQGVSRGAARCRFPHPALPGYQSLSLQGAPRAPSILLAGPGWLTCQCFAQGSWLALGKSQSTAVTWCEQRFGECWELLGQEHSSPFAPWPMHWRSSRNPALGWDAGLEGAKTLPSTPTPLPQGRLVGSSPMSLSPWGFCPTVVLPLIFPFSWPDF